MNQRKQNRKARSAVSRVVRGRDSSLEDGVYIKVYPSIKLGAMMNRPYDIPRLDLHVQDQDALVTVDIHRLLPDKSKCKCGYSVDGFTSHVLTTQYVGTGLEVAPPSPPKERYEV